MVPAEDTHSGAHPSQSGSVVRQVDTSSDGPRLWAPAVDPTEPEGANKPGPKLLQQISDDPGPDLDLARLLDQLNRNLGFVQSLPDPAELRGSVNPLAALNGYRHRLQAARAAHAAAQLRVEELEGRLRQAEDRLRDKESRLRQTEDGLRRTIDLWQTEVSAIRSSRGWRLVQTARAIRQCLSSAWAVLAKALREH
jgi:hypothetical protein